MNVYGITDCGLVRTMNQDSYASCELDHGILAVVCDGMGGAKSGNVASQMAVDRFVSAIQESTMEEPAAVLNQALDEANDAVRRRSLEDENCAGMGTTLVAAYLQSDLHGYVLNVGDSRCYQIGASGIRQITRDHSLVAELVALGARSRRRRPALIPIRILLPGLWAPTATRPAICLKWSWSRMSTFCSAATGSSNVVTEQEILYEVLHGGAADSCCQRLLEIALQRGAPDNVTVVLIEADGQNH